MNIPNVSVIIAPEIFGHLDETVKFLLNQSVHQDLEIIIVDGMVHKNKWQALIKPLLHAYPDQPIHYLQLPNSGRASCLNKGAAIAKAELLLFFGADFFATPQLIEHHLNLHQQQPDEKVVGFGPAIFPDTIVVTPFMRWLENSGSLYGATFLDRTKISPHFFWGMNTSIKKSFFNKVGRFDENFPYHAWDDSELGIRLREAGMQTVYLPDALAYHDHEVSLPDRKMSIFQAGESAAIFEIKYPDWQPHWKLVWFPPFLWKIAAHVARLFNNDGKYYQRMLDAAFSEGYKKGKTKLKIPSVG